LTDTGVALAQRSVAAEESEIVEIKRLESDRIAAGLRKDVKGFADAAADDFIQIDADGRMSDKETTLRRMQSSSAQLLSNPVDEMVVRVYADTAIVTARARPKGVLNGKEFSRVLRYTRVYVKRDGRWRIVLFQQTSIQDDTP
jgi:ketosteroid isomerase-like protein